MGRPMAKNLRRHGHPVVVCAHRSRTAVNELVALGAAEAPSPREVAAQVDVVITMLPNSPEVRAVLLGPEGVAAGARPGLVVVDMSSISPLVSQELARDLLARGIELLDAPVSGGEPKAIAGTLAVMVGGKQEIFDRVEPVLKAMAASVVRVGDVGAGNVTKLANQMIVALNIAAISEALVFATKAGVKPELVFQAIRGGLAGSAALEAKVPLMLARKIEPGFRLNLHIKDLANALESAHGVGAVVPLTAQVMEMLQALRTDGFGDADHGALVRHYEQLSRVEIGHGQA